LKTRDLYLRGLSVGREHIASLVYTLALAYAGASLPLFLVFTINQAQPFWVVLNGENIAEEFVRTIVGSIGLMMAVPISTWIAAEVFSKDKAA
ncbi:MAG: YibE/F family protein, partial [Patescibacteria group bacterium]